MPVADTRQAKEVSVSDMTDKHEGLIFTWTATFAQFSKNTREHKDMDVPSKIMQIIINYFILTSYKKPKPKETKKPHTQDKRKVNPEDTKENSFHSAATLAKTGLLSNTVQRLTCLLQVCSSAPRG